MSGLFSRPKAPNVPAAPKYKPPKDDSAAKKAAELDAKRRRASTILTQDDMDAPTTSILGG